MCVVSMVGMGDFFAFIYGDAHACTWPYVGGVNTFLLLIILPGTVQCLWCVCGVFPLNYIYL